jgi:hypothetical protein
MNTDCAWCGTGEGICDDHMAALFAQSAELAATGLYRASTTESEQENQETSNEQAPQAQK